MSPCPPFPTVVAACSHACGSALVFAVAPPTPPSHASPQPALCTLVVAIGPASSAQPRSPP
jgi:hypothetical protein